MGDKSLKSKQRDQKQKTAAKAGSAAVAKTKQDSYQPPPADLGEGKEVACRDERNPFGCSILHVECSILPRPFALARQLRAGFLLCYCSGGPLQRNEESTWRECWQIQNCSKSPQKRSQAQIQVAQAPGFGETLKAVQERGTLICGVNGQLPGFSFLDPQGNYSGFDADFCRALAAAIFGDPSKVEFRPTTTQERFTVLQTGEIDVLSRNTTWSLVRDTELGFNFAGVTFYDGQGIMVPTDSGITSLADLEGGTICVQKGTTTELNLADVMATEGIS